MKFINPTFQSASFTCPNCGVTTSQIWSKNISITYHSTEPDGRVIARNYEISKYHICKCSHCTDISIWGGNKMIFPLVGTVPNPNDDLPTTIQEDYLEARNIVNLSPRGAAALLRLAVQKLCIELGEKGKNINDDIKNLVKKGLPETMQQALDSVRVIGNNAVHPGQIDLSDNVDIAYKLFGFINIIAEMLISQPKRIKEFYELNIPEELRNQINQRDNKE
jgi:hypothetical protein